MRLQKLTAPWWTLRIVLGSTAFLAGLDKFFNLLANWPGYLSPAAVRLLPMSPVSFMHFAGVVEMAVGCVVLAGLTRLGGYVVAVWLLGIAANLVSSGRFYDVAVRDIAMAASAFTLARLTEAGVGATTGEAATQAAMESASGERAGKGVAGLRKTA